MNRNDLGPVLVTGATGYVGARLVPRLLDAGYRVRALSRSLDKLKSRAWAEHPNIEFVVADALEPDALAGAVTGCGAADRLAGGIRLRRLRRHDSELAVGDPVDFWRVVSMDPPQRLTLVSEMKLPGQALLEFRIRQLGDRLTELEQNTLFMPSGLGGMLYWRSIWPFRALVFNGMLIGMSQAIGKHVERGPERIEPAPKLIAEI